MALILRPDGGEEEVSPASGKTFSLEELQKIVGEGTPTGRGSIEIVPCKAKQHLLVLNEEGKRLGRPINARASELAARPTQADRERLRPPLGEPLTVAGDHARLPGPHAIGGTALL